MEAAEFKLILELGLGRAIVYLQGHDAAPYRDVILYACLHEVDYDPRWGRRAEYMVDILELTGDKSFYRERILSELKKVSEWTTDEHGEYDQCQLLDLSTLLAKQGDEQARKQVYEDFVENVAAGHLLGQRQLLELDGLEGFLFVADLLGEMALTGNELFDEYGPLLWDLEKLLGQEAATHALERASAENERVKAYLDSVHDHQKRRQDERKRTQSPDISEVSYDELKVWITDTEKRRQQSHLAWRTWGKQASEEDLRRAAEDLLAVGQDNPAQLLFYLDIFEERAFPLDPTPLFAWAEQEGNPLLHKRDEVPSAHIPFRALRALENINHADVRAFALRMIESSNKTGGAVRLLAKNFQEGDWQLIADVTARQLDEDDYHLLQLSVQQVCEAHPSKEAAMALLNLYERGPCSFCRRHIVELLHSLDALPDWMLEECKHDANLDLREQARRNFAE